MYISYVNKKRMNFKGRNILLDVLELNTKGSAGLRGRGLTPEVKDRNVTPRIFIEGSVFVK